MWTMTTGTALRRVDILDAVTGTVLDSRSLSGFQNGQYLVWNLTGHVKIQLTMTAVNAVVSGIFFDLPAPPDFALAASPSGQRREPEATPATT